ncbi:MAG: DUF2252 family protein [Polyangiales bacterium]
MSPTRSEDLARSQLQRDRARCADRPWLLAQKLARMSASPFAYLRGTAPLYYDLLAKERALRDGPAGEGWIVGDLHVENFGAYRAGRADLSPDAVVFGLNDFDEAAVGPWRFDLVRLVASVLMAGRELRLAVDDAVSLAEGLLDAWCAQVFDAAPAVAGSAAVTRMVECVERRTRQELLDDRTKVEKGRRVFKRSAKYRDLDAAEHRLATQVFARFADALEAAERPPREALAVEDVAFRVAGTGSLGTLRVAVLTRGKGDPDGSWIFDMKSEGPAAAEAVVGAQELTGARRVVAAMERCLDVRPRMVAAVEHEGRSFLVRRLAPQEDKLDFSLVDVRQLPELSRHLGAIAGRAHRKGATKVPPRWTRADLDAVLSNAIEVVGVHQGAWLSHCVEVRRTGEAVASPTR